MKKIIVVLANGKTIQFKADVFSFGNTRLLDILLSDGTVVAQFQADQVAGAFDENYMERPSIAF